MALRFPGSVAALKLQKSNVKYRRLGKKIIFLQSSQVNTLPKEKSETRSKQNKDMHKFSSVNSERGVPLPVLTSGGE
jgi:hypothetical protein